MLRTVIGLEIHAQLKTETKAFCSCRADVFDLEPNTAICPVCTGQPGTLPVLNKKVVEFAVLAGIAMNCTINKRSVFDRKNYFYPDLPKGYQITQYFFPIAENGYLYLENGEEKRKVRIRRIHIEEDAGKMVHQGTDSITGSSGSLVDLNRCGVPLIEIVTEPDLRSPSEARIFMELLRDTLRALEVCSGDMEKGALRCDANISMVDETGRSSNRVEVKNINSFKFVEKALEFEQERISKALLSGEDVAKETRSWSFSSKETFSMRSKEEENDYRYFPEPDLPVLVVSDEVIERIKESLPELPWQKIDRFVEQYSLPRYDASVLSSDGDIASYFEEVAQVTGKPKESSNWIMGEVMRFMNDKGLTIEEVKVSPEHFKELFDLIDEGKISNKIAKDIFPTVVEEKKSPREIVREKGLEQIDDDKVIEDALQKAMVNNPVAVQQFRDGKEGVLGYFVGAVMKATRGKANPSKVNEIARRMLKG
ncbi:MULTISPECIES: Asp-tRNA(Asn)/Glu-tRNA(Gln) amidotransferase subunit GatB [Mesotoga]|jgi:aspartyl-tRNA(Asn)/glutamyl-tRNA(Gln) amidotransferase subunit B|uniref:Asp-tRNA(Asn)/Glu-tRNA(Gln) amidotransferase subunit GatB n=1 Tax=Mesotoga TaxID=1184396 RepID=UPI0002CBB3D7|nr:MULTISPECIES: Asp-tRNA(Asn)/Glu-tRNA(Gln) amidotransferase subunit GatB [Mesotoga]MCP5456802.1 Asp-tRNA(Asn)/Glu-tRNA(Gln) amidotransferase subunit GatB [Thermotogota bacterium]CCU86101.1 Aspartyl/glutamyl-tRNA(Asn/Gln) amidotransferase subunit B [Mesotoga infera]MCB1222732.1 Asp-tRNA(Asn)/Glu-tRNA(Gln) amidotransferase subunit GatB [Mesotoga sp.]MCP5460979.1 Asp-tRNA(Asn)/Glu-tRNA(Gln) amidotransferase subunit GatB [Thermotogota bacterium]MDK2943592.1 aspartyl-tRNA(Asn)/glutamyl-tRNA(Gln) 